MRTIRASEIGSFIYCKRSWWYASQGIPSENQEALALGGEYHQKHSQKIRRSILLRWSGYTLLMAAIILLAVFVTLQILS